MVKNNVVYFEKKTFENLIFLSVKLNGVAITALFDTGASISFITESIREQLGDIAVKSVINAGNNQGVKNKFETITVNSLEIGTTQLLSQEIGVIPNEALDFGEDSQRNVFPASMLLGWDIISQLCWKFDMTNKNVIIEKGGIMPKSDNITWDNFPILSVVYDGKKFDFGFDSGHTESYLDCTWAEMLSGLKEKEVSVVGIGSVSDEQVKVVENFNFSFGKTNIALHNLEIAAHTIYGSKKGSICGLFGADIIEGKKWILDFESRKFEILP